MQLKTDEQGQVMVVDGKPVYRYPDGSEAPFNVQEAMERINQLKNESDQQQLTIAQWQSRYQGIEDPEMAKMALAKLKELEASGPDDVRKQLASDFEQEKKAQLAAFEERVALLESELNHKKQTIYDLMVTSRFAASSLIGEQTVLPPDIAAGTFGKYFQVEEIDGQMQVVGYLNGGRIYSRKKPGEVALFEEALHIILDAYPYRDRIMKGAKGGSAAQGGGGEVGEQYTLASWRKKLSEVRGVERERLLKRAAAGQIVVKG